MSKTTQTFVTITQDNFEETFRKVLLANVRLQNYSNIVISTGDVQRAIGARRVVLTFLEGLIASGNNPYLVARDVLAEFDYTLAGDFDENWSEEAFQHITDIKPFSFVIREVEHTIYENMAYLAELTRSQLTESGESLREYLDSKNYR